MDRAKADTRKGRYNGERARYDGERARAGTMAVRGTAEGELRRGKSVEDSRWEKNQT